MLLKNVYNMNVTFSIGHIYTLLSWAQLKGRACEIINANHLTASYHNWQQVSTNKMEGEGLNHGTLWYNMNPHLYICK